MIRDTVPAEELWNKARAVSQYYGFTPLSELTEKTRGLHKKEASANPATLDSVSLDPVAETVASFLRQCREGGLALPNRQPLFIWHTNIAPGPLRRSSSEASRPVQKKVTVQFHAFGADRALTDAVVIRALMTLVRDLFHEEPVLRVNSMGDKETRARYARELSNFFKKRACNLPEDCLSCAKRDTLEAAGLLIAPAGGTASVGRDYADELPAPTEHLSDSSRKRFEDLLEYLEMTDTPYELARTLFSRGGAWNDLCFEILTGGRRIAWGSRYGEFLHHFFPGGPQSATAAILQLSASGTVAAKSRHSRVRFSFVHIGDEAKRLSIRLAEDFHRARVSLSQHIGVESLIDQLNLAERQGSPYLLIMGRKEALESSVILRNRHTQEEISLPLAGLTERLKAIA
ncbi:hypothetical protein HYV30_00340 [Candidatus Kaiserbacteria bacterium]|nr:hypothetical protein [Candidatus Kaiserbacteria bacterium]